jgi:hypothetical protein
VAVLRGLHRQGRCRGSPSFSAMPIACNACGAGWATQSASKLAQPLIIQINRAARPGSGFGASGYDTSAHFFVIKGGRGRIGCCGSKLLHRSLPCSLGEAKAVPIHVACCAGPR